MANVDCEYCGGQDIDQPRCDLPLYGNSIGSQAYIHDSGDSLSYIEITGEAINGSFLMIPIKNCPMCGKRLPND